MSKTLQTISASRTSPLADSGSVLLETDRRYFEMGARLRPLHGATIAYVPDHVAHPAGCLIHRVDPRRITDANAWVQQAYQQIDRLGARFRLYLDQPHGQLEQTLRDRGYERWEEVGLCMPEAQASEAGPRIELRSVQTEADWQEKERVFESHPLGYDGHPMKAKQRLAIERHRCERGELEPLLAVRDGQVCASVARQPHGPLLRMKNLVVHARFGRQGVGSAITLTLAAQAQMQGRRLGLFAMAGGQGESMYRRLGLVPIIRQIEYVQRN